METVFKGTVLISYDVGLQKHFNTSTGNWRCGCGMLRHACATVNLL